MLWDMRTWATWSNCWNSAIVPFKLVKHLSRYNRVSMVSELFSTSERYSPWRTHPTWLIPSKRSWCWRINSSKCYSSKANRHEWSSVKVDSYEAVTYHLVVWESCYRQRQRVHKDHRLLLRLRSVMLLRMLWSFRLICEEKNRLLNQLPATLRILNSMKTT